jgi:mannose-1-phosphate guanylyltransferase
LQATLDRLLPTVPAERVFVVTGPSYVVGISRQLPELPVANILVEPTPRDSCPAISLAAALISRENPKAVMGAFSADHLVPDAQRFRQVLQEAIGAAEKGYIVPIGVVPEYAEPGYGYIEYGERIDGLVHKVVQFKEKPSREVAEKWVEAGGFLWNTSMFVWRVDVYLDELKRQQPELYDGVTRIAESWGGPDHEEVLAECWPKLPKISLDYGVIEGASKTGIVATAIGDFKWNDIGDFNSLATVLPSDENKNVVVIPSLNTEDEAAGEVVFDDTTGTLVVPHSGRMIHAVGVRDLIIVDTGDVLLVCRRDRAQDVKKIVESVREAMGERLL